MFRWDVKRGLADVYTVFATTAPEKGAKGISVFLVEKDAPGFATGKKEEKMGIRVPQISKTGHWRLITEH